MSYYSTSHSHLSRRNSSFGRSHSSFSRQGFSSRRSARSTKALFKFSNRGFTLIELLVVIVIMLVIVGVFWFVVNPPELAREARDSARLVDLYNLNQAIGEMASNTDLPKTEILCVGGLSSGICSSTSNQTGANNNLDGTGWVKVNLLGKKQLSTLPMDPLNNNDYHYTYTSDGENWELNAKLESQKYITDQQKMTQDDGNNNNVFEIGTDRTLIP